VGKVRRF